MKHITLIIIALLSSITAIAQQTFNTDFTQTKVMKISGKTTQKAGHLNFDESGEKINVTFEGTTMKLTHKTVDGSTTIEWGYDLTPAPLSVR